MPLCEGCGASYEDNFQFCPHCGRAKPKPVEIKMNIQDDTGLACPFCHRSDKVQKVSAYLGHNTVNLQGVTIEKRTYEDKDGKSYTSTENVPFNGTQTSVLAKKLQPPVQPRAKGKPGGAWWLRNVVGFYARMGIGGVILAAIGMIMLISRGETKELPFMALGALFSLFFGTVFMVWFRSLNTKYKKKCDEYNKEVIRVQSQEFPKWQTVIENWNELYYCDRDSYVFIPGKSGVPVDKMMDYISSR